jgi:hypothetical protein
MWAAKWWLLATALAGLNYDNTILHSGYFSVKTATFEYIYYFGFNSGTAGLVFGVLLGVFCSKGMSYVRAHRKPKDWFLWQEAKSFLDPDPGNPHENTRANIWDSEAP